MTAWVQPARCQCVRPAAPRAIHHATCLSASRPAACHGNLAPWVPALESAGLRLLERKLSDTHYPKLSHINLVVVVFDVKHSGQDAASIRLLTLGFLRTSRRIRSTRSAGRNVSLTSPNCTPAFNRSRSLASRSS